MMPIDYVIPFVDSSDREWVRDVQKKVSLRFNNSLYL